MRARGSVESPRGLLQGVSEGRRGRSRAAADDRMAVFDLPRTDQPAFPCGGKGAMAFRSWHPGTGPSSALRAPRGPCQPCQTAVTLRAVAFQPGTTSSLHSLLRLGPGPKVEPHLTDGMDRPRMFPQSSLTVSCQTGGSLQTAQPGPFLQLQSFVKTPRK